MKLKYFASIPLFTILTLLPLLGEAFCGFYVAKADVKLNNKTSEVIIVRNGSKTTITMASDFDGPVKDFAMVVPVPTVLQRSDIKIGDQTLFNKFNTYSSPRMVNYYDPMPCNRYTYTKDAYNFSEADIAIAAPTAGAVMRTNNSYNVQVVATYNVEEYEIKILSAQESDGLERWLKDNGYKIPKGASEVLEPYINDNMKFFVVKIDLDKAPQGANAKNLRPLQIKFESSRFGLPIRLGMANSSGTQDMLVYCLSKTGRVETVNYRTVPIPTDFNIPYRIQQHGTFSTFYKDLFDQQYRTERKSATFLEYAWNISGNVAVKCDPCNGPPPIYHEMVSAGVDWLKSHRAGFTGNIFFTRLHVRYDRQNFPQDLVFQETPNTQNFQARYVVRIPAQGPFECQAGQDYVKNLKKQRAEEVINMITYAGGTTSDYMGYISEYDMYYNGSVPTPTTDQIEQDGFTVPRTTGGAIFVLAGLGLTLVVIRRRRKRRREGRMG